MIESLRNIFAIPDLRKRLMFTFGLLAVYRIGCHVPTPGVDPQALLEFMESMQSTFLGFVNTFTGGSLERVAVFALGIMPYITSSIILQLLTVVWPYLEKLSKEGELGRKKITQYTRYGTVLVSIIQSTGIALFLEKTTTPGGAALVPSPGWAFRLLTILTLTTGCAFIMWLGEQISERGIGNGISLIIFAGIVVGLPSAVASTVAGIRSNELSIIGILILIAFMVLVVAFIVYMERAQRRIPVQYAKRMVGRKVYGGQSTYLPLRVNTAGVIPVIFASSLMALPATAAQMFQAPWLQKIADQLAWGQPLHYLLYVVGIIFFSYFYISIIFNPSRSGGEHAEVREFHPWHPLRQEDGRVHRSDPDPDFSGGSGLSRPGGDPARLPPQRHQDAEPAVHRASHRSVPAEVHHRGHGYPVLLRRHVAADRGRCRHGLPAAGREPAGDAQL